MTVRHLPPPNVTFTVKNVDARVLQRLADQAGIEGMSRQAWIRRALVDFLRGQDPSINRLRRHARLSGGLTSTETRTLMDRHVERSVRINISSVEHIERAHRNRRGLTPLPTGTLCLKGVHPLLAEAIGVCATRNGLSDQELIRQVLRVTAACPTPREELLDVR